MHDDIPSGDEADLKSFGGGDGRLAKTGGILGVSSFPCFVRFISDRWMSTPRQIVDEKEDCASYPYGYFLRSSKFLNARQRSGLARTARF